jgi:acyl-CoA thioester hydrolase
VGFVLAVRIYLEDTDAQGVVYNASYFRFMERARTEWLRARGVDHDALRREHGVQLVLTRVETEFRVPARLSDVLEVEARIVESRGARVVFGHEIRRAPQEGAAERESSRASQEGAAERESSRASQESAAAGESSRAPQEGAAAEELICRGTAEVACVDAELGRPRRLPATLLSGMSR